MYLAEASNGPARLEDVQHLLVSDHHDVLVGHKHLERVDPRSSQLHRLHTFVHLLTNWIRMNPSMKVLLLLLLSFLGHMHTLVTPPGDSHVEGKVATDLGVSPRSPLLVGLHQRLS